jgi:integrase
LSVHKVMRKNGKTVHIVHWREAGHKRNRAFTLRKDALAFDREVTRRRQLGSLAVQQLTATSPTLAEWIVQHWTPEHGVTLAQSTRDRYANVYACHIEPTLGSTPLSEITVRTLRAWQAGRIAAGVNPGSIAKARTFLSSVLRHAAESEAIAANPLSVVRAPRNGQRDSVRPLAPATVEAVRRELLDPAPREIGASSPGQRARRRYELVAPGTPATRRRDALIVSILAYAGLRPGELRALRWSDIGEATINVQRGADDDGRVKTTKNCQGRSVRLLAPLAQELREYRLSVGRPPAAGLLLPGDDGRAWTKAQWQCWRRDRWQPACRAVGLDPAPRPYDCRHSFASLLLAEGRQPRWIADQLGHTLAVLLSTYSHLIAEFEDRPNIDAEREILAARGAERASGVQGRAPGGRP